MHRVGLFVNKSSKFANILRFTKCRFNSLSASTYWRSSFLKDPMISYSGMTQTDSFTCFYLDFLDVDWISIFFVNFLSNCFLNIVLKVPSIIKGAETVDLGARLVSSFPKRLIWLDIQKF